MVFLPIVIGGTDAEALVMEGNAAIPRVLLPSIGSAVVRHHGCQLISQSVWCANEARAGIDAKECNLICHCEWPIWSLTRVVHMLMVVYFYCG